MKCRKFVMLLCLLGFYMFFGFCLVMMYRNGYRYEEPVKETTVLAYEEPDLVPKVKLAITIVTFPRNGAGYLIQTLRRLLENLPQKKKSNIVIGVMRSMSVKEALYRMVQIMNANPEIYKEYWFLNSLVEEDYFAVLRDGNEMEYQLKKTLRSLFRQEMDNGIIEVFHSPPELYLPLFMPNACNLERNFGESFYRVLWRTKLNLDGSFAWFRYLRRAEYHLRLEDDTSPDETTTYTWYSELFKMIETNSSKWRMISIYNHNPMTLSDLNFMGGAFGYVFRQEHLNLLIRHLWESFDVAPIDWNVNTFLKALCKMGRLSLHQCLLRKPLLKHYGHISSKGKCADFDAPDTWQKVGCPTSHTSLYPDESSFAAKDFMNKLQLLQAQPALPTDELAFMTFPRWKNLVNPSHFLRKSVLKQPAC